MNKKEMLLKEKYGRIRGGQSDLARDLNTIPSTVKRWLTGGGIPSPDYVEKLAKVFGKTEEEIKEIFCEGKNFSQKGTQNIIGAVNAPNVVGSGQIKNTQSAPEYVSKLEFELLKKDVEILKKNNEILTLKLEALQRRTK
jgi:transcriptional regulator with XRE-family HTH domain